MSQPSFRFRQFEIYHDRCAMKVGTDGVLLGAWADVEHARRILDIGTGSALIAIMAAQRNASAQIIGVEIDSEAVAQARENVSRSPWSERVEIDLQDICNTSADQIGQFDCILCNPPFFIEDTLSPDSLRAAARHASGLTFDRLLCAVDRLITPDGTLSVILPSNARNQFITIGLKYKLFKCRECSVRTVPHKDIRRVMLTFSRTKYPIQAEELTLQNPDGTRTEAYANLTQEFYL